MTHQQLLKKYDALPPAARKQVDRLMASLSKRRPAGRPKKPKANLSWEDEPAFGMWKDREDMQDSAQWVQELRRKHWERTRG